MEALADESISRRHASVAFDGRRWTVRDHGSRNGTLVDGERVAPERVVSEVPGRTDEGAGEELAGPERAEGEGPGRSDVEEALERAAGNVSAAARSLGVHRNQLRLLIARHDIDGRRFAKSGDA